MSQWAGRSEGGVIRQCRCRPFLSRTVNRISQSRASHIEHVLGEHGFRVGHAQLSSALVRHGEQTSYAARDGIPGQLGVGELPPLFINSKT